MKSSKSGSIIELGLATRGMSKCDGGILAFQRPSLQAAISSGQWPPIYKVSYVFVRERRIQSRAIIRNLSFPL